VRARLIPVAGLEPRDLDAWRGLAERAVEPNPFFEPELVLPAARHLGGGPGLLVAEREGRWSACLVVHRPARWRRLPLPTLATWRHSYCFLGTPLAIGDELEPALAALIDRGRREPGVAALALDWVGADGPVWDCLTELVGRDARTAVHWGRFDRAVLRRRAEPTYLDETLRGHHRRELQRKRRTLARDVGEPVTTVDRGGDPAAYAEFLRLEASGWKGRSGTALGAHPGHARFFTELCEGFAPAGRLQLLELSAGGRAVAMMSSLVAGGALYGFKIAYDETYGGYSPGIQLVRDSVEIFHERGDLTWIDSCADPDNDMINRLWTERRSIATVVVPARGPLGWAARHGTRAAAAVRNRMRSVR
jgi:hypothetical protein